MLLKPVSDVRDWKPALAAHADRRGVTAGRGRRATMSVLHDTQDAHEVYEKGHNGSEQVEDASMESAAASALMTEPLSPLETRRANAEAINRAPQTSEAVSEARRRGRIEAETHRISEEMTHLAQERRRAEEACAQPTDANPAAGTALSRATSVLYEEAHPYATVAPLPPLPTSCQFKRVLAPLDGSFYAERALPYATALARLTGADVLLGHVRQPSPSGPKQTVRRAAGEMHSGEREPRTADMQSYLEALRALEAFHASTVRVDTIQRRDAAAGVCLLAEQDNADVVALATHARQGIERHALGSTVDALVEHSHLPLLIIPPNVVVQPEPTFGRVLVPLDGSLLAEQALGVLLGVIQASASSNVVHQEVADWQITLFTAIARRALMVEAFAYLNEVEARLRASGLPQEARTSKQVQLGSARGAIVAAASHGVPAAQSAASSAGAFDLVALATHGRGGLGRLLYGSVAHYVLPRVAVPVLLVHPADISG
jgi:nucleotide-binding universal stress UspA family protein